MMSSGRMAVIGLVIILGAAAAYFLWQSQRVSLDVPLARSASHVLYLKENPLDLEHPYQSDAYVLDTDTGTITQMTKNYKVIRADWSADGERLVLQTVEKNRFEILANGQSRDLPDLDGAVPAFSPDQTYFAYDLCHYDDYYNLTSPYEWIMAETASIFIVEAANPANTREIKNACFAAWSPQGDQIAYTSQQSDDADPEIYIENRDGSKQHRLAVNPGADTHSVWSPDGTHLAFRTNMNIGSGMGEGLYLMDADGQNLTLIARLPGHFTFEWSPDRQMLLYTHYTDSDNLCVANADDKTSNCSDLGKISSATWSADGKQLVYRQSKPWGHGLVCLTDPLVLAETRCFPGTELVRVVAWRP